MYTNIELTLQIAKFLRYFIIHHDHMNQCIRTNFNNKKCNNINLRKEVKQDSKQR